MRGHSLVELTEHDNSAADIIIHITNVMINFRRDDEALLAAALTGFTWSSVGLVEDENNLN